MTASTFERILTVEGGFNLRDLGGYTGIDGHSVKGGVLYRSGQMAKLTDTGARQIAALGIRCIIDFRRHSECATQPTVWHMGANIEYWTRDYNAPSGELAEVAKVETTTAPAMHAAMISLYRDLPHQHAESYRHMFDRLTAGRVPLLFNCAAGKDRTGIAAALILHTLGVSRATIMEDYLLTNRADVLGLVTLEDRYSRISRAARERLTAADVDYLNAMYAELDTSFGGIDDYIERVLGVDVEKREALRNRLLSR